MTVRSLLEQLERAGTDPTAALAFIAAQSLELGEDELRAARRRAVLVLAAGGDPGRDLSPGEPAVATLARDLDTAARRLLLMGALGRLADEAGELPLVSESLGLLLADDDLAWRWAACTLLAEELADG